MKHTKYITYLFLCLLYGLLSSCSFEQEDSLLLSLKSASNLNGNLNCSKELEHYAS